MTRPALSRSPSADKKLAELVAIITHGKLSAKRRRYHRNLCRAAVAGFRSAWRMAIVASREGFPKEAAEHRARARWYLGLARRHKDALA